VATGCGFVIEGTLPAGVHLTHFEAQTTDGSWHGFQTLSLAVEPAPFMAVLDEPIAEGVLRDRVIVGGWALQPGDKLTELVLRYGHRELPCELGRPRRDVPKLFPHEPDAASAGFESATHLVAGHGPVRLRGKLANGRTVFASTKVSFSVATDENHGPEIDLTAARVALPGYDRVAIGLRACGADANRHFDKLSAGTQPVATPKTDQPLNVLFILYGSFASNSALHVAALANELSLAGHRCIVAVPHDLETMAHHEAACFRGISHAEAEAGVVFADGRSADIIHAWTTRENVRQLAEKVRDASGGKLIVHLEDNEQQILALTLQRSAAELDSLPKNELDRLVPEDLSHPQRSRQMLAEADGVTVITDKLHEFIPGGRTSLTLTPAADARYFYPRPRPMEFRQALGLSVDTTVLFYHGNAHASNAAEMRELYAAVLRLNRDGHSTILLRTGLDRVDFIGSLASEVSPYVISLGQILHHRHLPPLMALADIFVQPGRTDAFNDYRFPSKLPEFFAIGRPVILPRTNLGAALRHGIDAYVLDQADAAGIAGAVRELRTDRKLYDQLALGATAYAAGHFSWRNSAEQLATFYRSMGEAVARPLPIPKSQRILVTGGRGRLASLIADHLRLPRTEPMDSGPWTNTGLAAASNGASYELELFSRQGGEGFTPLAALTEPSRLAGPGALLHLAWSTLPATSEKGGGTEWQEDLPALEKILQAITALPAGERPHFVFFSSGGTVYGNAPGRPNLETDLCQPIGYYGKAKCAAEKLIESYVTRLGLDCAILRVSNPYGYPVPKSRAQGIVPHAIRCAVDGQTLTLWGDGHAQKDFLHYTDFLSAVDQVIARRLTGTFNIGAGESHSVREVIALVEKQTGKKIAHSPQPAPAWDVEDSRLDNQKFMAATGWRPLVSLAEGIRRSAAAYAAH
jgi:UDP-glucose 4-epimerase